MKGFMLLFFLLYGFIFADDLSKMEFGFSSSFDLKSDSLPLNIFDKEWDLLPEHKVSNNAFGGIEYKAFINFNNLQFGVFREKNIDISMNDGFVEMWFESSKDFTTLLGMKGIGNSLKNIPIKASVDYYESDGVYLQKIFFMDSNQFGAKVKLHNAKNIQFLRVNGLNQNGRFATNFDYYYTNKNYISKYKSEYDNGSGIGYSVDLEYFAKSKNGVSVYLGLINTLSSIKWSGVSLMHYELDSSKSLGEPFGVGYYKYNQSFTQKLPIYGKVQIEYQLTDILSIGDNTNINKKTMFNEVYAQTKYNDYSLKIGNIIEVNQFIFGLGKRNTNLFNWKIVDTNLEMMRDLNFNNNVAKILLNATF